MKIYFSPQYYESITQLDKLGKKEYQLDSIAKPIWISQKAKKLKNVQITKPNLLTEKDLVLAHSQKYINSIKHGKPTNIANSSGLRWVPNLYIASLASVSGMYSAVKTSLKEKVSASLSTNFHHARTDIGGGFCVFNGIAISALKAVKDLNIKKILIIDCDYHHGDGTASILKDHKNVFIYDIYGGLHNKKIKLEKGSNIKLQNINNKSDYIKALRNLIKFAGDYNPDLVIYDAGMDVWENDRLAGIKGIDDELLTFRDEKIISYFAKNNIPLAFLPSGGYVRYKNSDGKMLSEEEIESNKRKLTNLYLNTIKSATKFVIV